MPHIERYYRLPLTIDKKILSKIRNAATLRKAVSLVLRYKEEDAIAIIDNLDQLSAAFILSYLRFMAEGGNTSAQKLVAGADKFHIRGSLGLIYARDKVYRETGYFAGT